MAWEITRVPEKAPSPPKESTVDVVAADVEPKLANALVRQLGQMAPLESLRHVKRVRRRTLEGTMLYADDATVTNARIAAASVNSVNLPWRMKWLDNFVGPLVFLESYLRNSVLSIILCPSLGHDYQLEGIPDNVQKLITDHNLSPFIAKVAKYAATSKEEWEEQCKLWPTSYHPTAKVDGVTGFSEEDLQWIISCMKITLKLARLNQLGNEGVNAALIVDPSSWQIIANATDQTSFGTTNVSKKSEVPECIENVEAFVEMKSQDVDFYENLFRTYTSDESIRTCVGVSCLYPWKWSHHEHSPENNPMNRSCNSFWHPLRHAAMVAVENAATRDRQLFPNHVDSENHSSSGDDLKYSSTYFTAKRQKTGNSQDEVKPVQEDSGDCLPGMMRPYLCTGFDIYLVWEPCTMCAMALVHQRIRRIFFTFPNPRAGALGSVHRLQGEKSLNHHYSVFRVSVDRGP